jgi:uncharacterized membrane protein YgcG
MYESPHPPPAVKASDATAHFLGIDWGGIDWTVWAISVATAAIVAYIMLKGRNRRRLHGAPSGAGNSDIANAAALLNDISWGPGHHSHTGSDAGHHGGFFDGGGGDAGGGGHH